MVTISKRYYRMERQDESKYSIITVNYNDAEGLERTIQSVVAQTYSDYEFIVIDGGSTDGSVDVIKKYEMHINYWVSEPDGGIYPAMNKGVVQAHGEYCIFINSGDLLYDNVVLERITKIDFNEDVVVGKVVSNKDGHLLFPLPSRDMSLYYLYSGTVPHQGSLIKTDLLRKFPYDESLKIVSDWKFYLQTLIINNSSIKYLDVIISKFDMDGVSTSNPEKMWMEKMNVLKDFFPPRLLADLEMMKSSECLTQTLTPLLRNNYWVDKLLYRIGSYLLKLKR